MAAFLGTRYKGILGSGFALGQSGIYIQSAAGLLLDQFGGAAAAYSVRKLSGSYSGSALRVRRSSNNEEQDIGFDSNGNLDTSALTTFVGANDGFVTTWYDQSGNGNDATQSTAANQPQIVSSGTIKSTNSKPAVDSLTDRFFVLDTQIRAFTTFSTVDITSENLINYIAGTTSPNIQGLFMGGSSVNGIGGIFNGTSRSSVAATDLTQALYYWLSDGTNLSVAKDGSSASNVGTLGGVNIVNLLARNDTAAVFSKALCQEVIIYSTDQSANKSAIESNINAHYNIYWDGSQQGLLDSHSGASAAYSVRALNSAYTDPLIRVRRSSDNAEKDIYALYDGSLDESALTTFVGANDGFVTTWYDQSGNGNDATQGTAADQPIIVSSGSLLTENGEPCITPNNGFSDLITGLAGATTNNSIWVTKAFSPSWTGNCLYQDTTVGAKYVGFIQSGSTNPIASNATISQIRVNGQIETPANRGEFATLLTSQSLVAIDANDSSFANIEIGYGNSGSFSLPKLQEVIFYQSDISASLSAIEANINAYYDMYWDGTVSDPDAQAFLDEVVAQGGSLTNEVADEYNAFVLREKAASRYSKLLRLYPFLGGVIDSARIDAINLGQAANNNFADADADATCGLAGNGVDKYLLDVNTYGSLSSPYNYQIFNFAKTIDTSGSNIYSWGGFDGANQVGQRMIGSTRYYFYANTTTILLDSLAGAASDGDSNICARFNATSAKLFLNGTEIDSSTTDATGFTDFGSAALFAAYSNEFSTPAAFSNEEKVGWILAENMTEAEALATESSYNTFLTNIGAI